MNPLDRLSEYLGAIERRLRLIALTRGIAVTAGMALALTVVAVLVINQFAFSNGSVIGARVFLFLGLAFAIAAALIIPVIRLNRRNAARRAEARYPQFEERLLTFTERIENNPGDPFLSLLADDTLRVAAAGRTQERRQERVDLQLLLRRRRRRAGADLARAPLRASWATAHRSCGRACPRAPPSRSIPSWWIRATAPSASAATS